MKFVRMTIVDAVTEITTFLESSYMWIGINSKWNGRANTACTHKRWSRGDRWFHTYTRSTMALTTNLSESALLTKLMMPNRLLPPVGMQLNSTMHPYPPYLFAGDEFNSTHLHELLLFNNISHYYYVCPSIQMPVGNLISMILYALVCIVGLFGNTLVIYAGNYAFDTNTIYIKYISSECRFPMFCINNFINR